MVFSKKLDVLVHRIAALFCLLTLTYSAAVGQESIDLLTLSGRFGTPQPFDDGVQGEATESGALANLKLPIRFNDRTIWFNNVTYTYSAVTNDVTFPENVMDPIGLHGFIVQTGLVQKINDNKAFQLLFVPRYMSDFKATAGRSWQFGAIGMYEVRYNKNLMLRYGVMFHQEKSGPLLVPLVDINWNMSDRWFMSGLFPIYLKIGYKVSERFTAGLSHFGLITSYALGGETYANDYMERTSIDLTLFGRWKMLGNLYLEGRAGYALGRNYAQFNEDQKIDLRLSILRFDDNRGDPVNTLFRDGPIAELRLVFNLPVE